MQRLINTKAVPSAKTAVAILQDASSDSAAEKILRLLNAFIIYRKE